MDLFLDFTLPVPGAQPELALGHVEGLKRGAPAPSPRGLEDFGLIFGLDGEERAAGSAATGASEQREEVDAEEMISLYTTFSSGGEAGAQSVKERRASRRRAAAAKAREGAGKGLEGLRCKQRRVKNRASVEKCRAKQRERLQRLGEEERELAVENERLRGLVDNLLADERLRGVLEER